MEDYTYDFGAAAPLMPRRAHAGGLPDHQRGASRAARSTRSSWASARTPCASSSPAAPGPGVVVGLCDMGTRLRLVANEVDAVEPPQDLPRLPVARALWQPRPDLATAAEAWLLAGGPHHTCFSQAVGLEVLEDFAEMVGVELLAIERGHGRPAASAASCAGTRSTGTSPARSERAAVRRRSAGVTSRGGRCTAQPGRPADGCQGVQRRAEPVSASADLEGDEAARMARSRFMASLAPRPK